MASDCAVQVVDACRRGNQARFINHSCEPNCETQKWMVKGELKIGFFATRDIPAGAEVQFDYNFDRFGDRPTKCHCGAPSCRGFIGGAGDRYDGQAVDDAAIVGMELPPIMLTGASSGMTTPGARLGNAPAFGTSRAAGGRLQCVRCGSGQLPRHDNSTQ